MLVKGGVGSDNPNKAGGLLVMGTLAVGLVTSLTLDDVAMALDVVAGDILLQKLHSQALSLLAFAVKCCCSVTRSDTLVRVGSRGTQ